MSNSYSDYFSDTASLYATYRPRYPASLFAWLADQVPNRTRAWDCGTGSGQAADALAQHFGEVIATDPSEAQIRHASACERVHYAAMTAEQSAIKDGSVQLVTVAQALHWFHLSSFYEESRRVLAPGGVLAVWTYGLLSIEAALDEQIRIFYTAEVGDYWPAERALVATGYGGIDFPFHELKPPEFQMTTNWTLHQLGGYLESWSAVSRYRKVHGHSPVGRFISAIQPLWGAPDTMKNVSWPLELRVGIHDPKLSAAARK